jgi:hypothetical protein
MTQFWRLEGRYVALLILERERERDLVHFDAEYMH